MFEGLPAAEIRALGGGASQFNMSAGNPETSVHQIDTAVFVGDDWRLRSNFTLNLGLRYETQTNISDHADFAPRVAFAWAPGASNNKTSKTVIRGGFGIFYDRFALANTLTAARYNGVVQQQYVVVNPDTYPNAPPSFRAVVRIRPFRKWTRTFALPPSCNRPQPWNASYR